MVTDMVILDQRNNTSFDILQKRSNWIFFALSFFSCIPLLYLFFKFGEAGFGYDIGIYRRYALEYFQAFFDPTINPFAFTAFSSLILFLGDSFNSFLLGWYVILTFFTTYTFGLLIRKITASNFLTGISLLLFTTSIIQFEFFSGFYYRNLLALFLMFSTLILLEYKSSFSKLPLLTLTAIHPLTAVVLFPTLFIVGIFQKENRKLILTTLFFAGVGSILLSWGEFFGYIKTLFGFIQHKEEILQYSTEFTGQFINSLQFLRFTLLYLPFTLIGIIYVGKKYIFWSIFGIINIILIVFQFFLFERFYIFLNIVFLFFAAHGLERVYQWFQNKKVFYTFIVSYSLLLLSTQTLYVLRKTPIISPIELTEIKNISTIIPQQSFILSFSSADASWLYGFAGNYKIIAPGTLHENKWSYDQWSEFWSTKDIKKRAALLNQYGTNEMYIYTREAFKDIAKDLFSNDPHIQSISPHLWKYQFSP